MKGIVAFIALLAALCPQAKFGETLPPGGQEMPDAPPAPPTIDNGAPLPEANREPNASFFGYPMTSLKGGLSLGFTFVQKPELDWTNGERQLLIMEGTQADVVTESKEFKNGMGLSIEYSHFLHQGLFIGAGADIWQKTTSKTSDKASLWPMVGYLNAGFFRPFQSDQNFFKLFGGIGIGRVGYDYDYVGVNYDAFVGLMYQFGIGIVVHNFFMDIVFRSIKVRYHEDVDIPTNNNADLASYKKRGKVSLDTPMLRIGLFF